MGLAEIWPSRLDSRGSRDVTDRMRVSGCVWWERARPLLITRLQGLCMALTLVVAILSSVVGVSLAAFVVDLLSDAIRHAATRSIDPFHTAKHR